MCFSSIIHILNLGRDIFPKPDFLLFSRAQWETEGETQARGEQGSDTTPEGEAAGPLSFMKVIEIRVVTENLTPRYSLERDMTSNKSSCYILKLMLTDSY